MSATAEIVHNYGTDGPHVSFFERLPWNRNKLQPAAQAVRRFEDEFKKHIDEFRYRRDLTVGYTDDGFQLRVRTAGRGFWFEETASVPREQDSTRYVTVGHTIELDNDGKIVLLDHGFLPFPKEALIGTLDQMRTDLIEVMAERQSRVATS